MCVLGLPPEGPLPACTREGAPTTSTSATRAADHSGWLGGAREPTGSARTLAGDTQAQTPPLLNPQAWNWVRPHLVENTTSRPICEVKQPQASLVLRSVMTWEPGVLYSLFFGPRHTAGCRHACRTTHHSSAALFRGGPPNPPQPCRGLHSWHRTAPFPASRLVAT